MLCQYLTRNGPKPLLDRSEEFVIADILMARPDIYLNELQNELFKNTGKWQALLPFFELPGAWHTQESNCVRLF